MWLEATGSPPARSVFRQFAHFATASGRLGKCAAAIASGDGNRTSAGGGVGPDGVGGDAGEQQEFQSQPSGPAAESIAAGAHERSLGEWEGKTTSSKGLKMGETGVMVRGEGGGRGRRFQIEFVCRFGAWR